MKTYISPLGFETTHVISLIVAHGIEKGDRIILLRPIASDSRADRAVADIMDLTAKVDRTITVDVVLIDHRNFGAMMLSLMDLIASAAPPVVPAGGKVIVNLSGGPREILIALTAASMALSELIYKTTNFSDIDRELREIELPHIARKLDKTAWQILRDLAGHEHTTLVEVATRTGASESTVSRQSAKLAGLRAVEIVPAGRSKRITLTLSGRALLKICECEA
ncbi:MAG: CRISPR-associated CARF protein Csa3 [Euryarchaeota archaeon]|nr:CRISPR-associated CARF protein Csa3 [Euryarchaeota archaeon]